MGNTRVCFAPKKRQRESNEDDDAPKRLKAEPREPPEKESAGPLQRVRYSSRMWTKLGVTFPLLRYDDVSLVSCTSLGRLLDPMQAAIA